MFYRRSVLNAACSASIEQRWYAHRANRYALVHEIAVDATTCSQDATLLLTSNTGPSSQDITFTQVQSSPLVFEGTINVPEESWSSKVAVAYATTPLPSSITVIAGSSQTFYYITTFRTSLDASTVNIRNVTNANIHIEPNR